MSRNNKYKKVFFYLVSILLPFILWLGLEFIANSMTHRFDPLKVDRKKQTLYLNQNYFTDFYLYDLDDYLNTSISNRAVHLKKQDRFRIITLGGSTTAGYPYNTLPQY
ncbi:MAG: hypothetical protein GXO75_04800, partial [Calditrichaeota bacterium]|nr:hypothetical protein [Calditrichota bacterium]